MSAVTVEHLSKVFRLYRHPVDRLKEALHPRRRKYHRDFYALNDVSFAVRPGETIGIIGRNGSGKSTLLKIIAGVLTPSAGTVGVRGRSAALLELGAGFNPEMTGIENIYFSGAIMGYTRREMERRLEAVTAFADIGEFIQLPVKTYSSGMFVRLAFAVAINVDPEILIVDEALAVGDISFQAKCFRKLNEFRARGKTVIFVTHALDTVIRNCSRAIVLDRGRKLVEADPKTAVDAYKRLMADCLDADAAPPVSSAAVKDQFVIDPNALSYGNQLARIEDFGLFDEDGRPTQVLHHGRKFTIRMKVVFTGAVANPIFAWTIKDIKGLEITGTNTLLKKIETGAFSRGESALVEFRQVLNCQSGQYALSLGCTGLGEDKLLVYHRLYDVLLFEVVAQEPMVGFYDLNSEIGLQRLPAGGP